MKALLATLLCFFTCLACEASVSPDSQGQIAAIEAYLNSIRTLTADFTQMNQDGSRYWGKFYLARPSQLRLQYKNPPHLNIITEGEYLVQHDKDGGGPVYIPLSSTPAGVILGKSVRLSGEVTVTSILPHPKGLSITVVRTQEPENGSISFLFRTEPTLQLERWIVYDPQGTITEVILSNVRSNEPLNPKIFKF